jgi:hypothetical protein
MLLWYLYDGLAVTATDRDDIIRLAEHDHDAIDCLQKRIIPWKALTCGQDCLLHECRMQALTRLDTARCRIKFAECGCEMPVDNDASEAKPCIGIL